MDPELRSRLAKIRRLFEGARSMPMSASAVVNRGDLLELLDGVEQQLQVTLHDAEGVLADRDALLEEARKEARRIVEDAERQQAGIASDTEVFRVAKRRADELAEDARRESEELRRETDDYVDGKLATFEITLERTLDAVRRGRDRLAGRSALDSLTEDEVDRIKLPEHLED